jgi:hypothetical protein
MLQLIPTDFSVAIPEYLEIPAVNNLYASPAPPPPIEVLYAQAIPPEVNGRIAERFRNAALAQGTPEPGPSMAVTTPYASPPATEVYNFSH